MWHKWLSTGISDTLEILWLSCVSRQSSVAPLCLLLDIGVSIIILDSLTCLRVGFYAFQQGLVTGLCLGAIFHMRTGYRISKRFLPRRYVHTTQIMIY